MSVHSEKRSGYLKAASNQKDATIAELRGKVSQLRLDINALEQYGRRSSLGISGISEQYEDTTEGVLTVTNGIIELDPPLKPEDINISHRLNKPRGARQEEPRPVIVRFMTKTARYRVIADRRNSRNIMRRTILKYISTRIWRLIVLNCLVWSVNYRKTTTSVSAGHIIEI